MSSIVINQGSRLDDIISQPNRIIYETAFKLFKKNYKVI